MRISRTKLELIQANQGLTALALAKKSGVSYQQISVIKARGTCLPLTLQKIADGLGCDPAELIEEED